MAKGGEKVVVLEEDGTETVFDNRDLEEERARVIERVLIGSDRALRSSNYYVWRFIEAGIAIPTGIKDKREEIYNVVDIALAAAKSATTLAGLDAVDVDVALLAKKKKLDDEIAKEQKPAEDDGK